MENPEFPLDKRCVSRKPDLWRRPLECWVSWHFIVVVFLSVWPHRLLSSVKNNVGRGLNIALVNGQYRPDIFRTERMSPLMVLWPIDVLLFSPSPRCDGPAAGYKDLWYVGRRWAVVSFCFCNCLCITCIDYIRTTNSPNLIRCSSTDVSELLKFLRPLHEGTLVFVASFDDPATK